jgi:hypothetical protein
MSLQAVLDRLREVGRLTAGHSLDLQPGQQHHVLDQLPHRVDLVAHLIHGLLALDLVERQRQRVDQRQHPRQGGAQLV